MFDNSENSNFFSWVCLLMVLSGCTGTTRVISPELPFQAECFAALVDKHFEHTSISYEPPDDDLDLDIDERIYLLSLAFEMEDEL